MDQTAYSLIFVSLLLTFIALFDLKFKSKPNQRLPPGPWRIPIIGNLHQLLSPLPCYTLRDLSRRYGPLMLLQLGKIRMVTVSSPEIAKEIMKTHDITFTSRAISTTLFHALLDYKKGVLFAPYGEHWRHMRKICNQELLGPKKVQSFTSIRNEEVTDLIELIKSDSLQNKTVNLTKKLEVMINDITLRTMLGHKSKAQDSYLDAVRKLSEFGAGFSLVDMFPSSQLVRLLSPTMIKVRRYRKYVSYHLDSVVKQQKERKACQRDGEVEDLISVLLRMHEEGTADVPLEMENVKAMLSDIFGGATETTWTTIEWAMSELMRNPRVMEKAQTEVRTYFKGLTSEDEMDLSKLNYMQLVIKETLRLHPPAPIIARRQIQQETCIIYGYDIPKGTTVLVNVWAIARDPKYWDEPEEFRPERFSDKNIDFRGMNFEFIPFGAGRRICPGMTFGLATVELALVSLIYHFDWKLPDGLKPEELDMSEKYAMIMSKKSPLLLCAVPHKTSL